MSTGNIDDACKEVVGKLDGAVACGVVDLDTGELLGIQSAAERTATIDEAIAAIADLFRGPDIGRIEQMAHANEDTAQDEDRHFQEVHITSEHYQHFAKTVKNGRAVVILITEKTTNIGMGWAQLKSMIPCVEPLI